MGLYASYYAISENKANEYKTLLANNDDESLQKFLYDVENLDENDETFLDEHYTSLDKLWDGLHFLLIGCTLTYEHTKTPAQIALHNGFFGQELLHKEGVCFLDANKVSNVVQALDDVDIDKLLDNVDFKTFAQAEIYPDIWEDEEDYEELYEELKFYFENFKQFYHNALKDKRSVLMVIC